MKIKINELFLLQEKLDNVVHKNHNIKNPMDVFIQRKLALAVEIAELANEVKCFKYWSVKKGYNKEKIGDEYADVLHFILSHAIYLNSKKNEYSISGKIYDKQDLTKFFLKLLELSSQLSNPSDCEIFLSIFFEISTSLSLSVDDIINFYKNKNDVNLQRQKNKY
ncbi:MAG: hypothetical protein HDR31_01160 [Mycoplasma sp.]|nr:hypothetical protein [Mycoplasma sp.]